MKESQDIIRTGPSKIIPSAFEGALLRLTKQKVGQVDAPSVTQHGKENK